ncbi:MFS transporter [Phytomonospora endophytica]|uniref:EmrB/QacA subfamily drug resistance transporter n=1 Tax=Phytomonospora endophytica TaxID=714109 RepID=A0A841FQQ0_9ACTN|nr:MFS transporter [Phytomonospora endophytica]MBB6036118.1 EmrB/QacA subfamily drug resistance transporter [Phytomonospora endophytica]
MTTLTSRPKAVVARLGARGWLTLITLCGATFMVGLDYSVVTVALPAIGRDLGFEGAGRLQWVATACLLPTASLIPLFGRVSDLVGRRRLFVLGVSLFTVMSVVAGSALSPGMLIGARVGQGVAAAMIGPTALALLTSVFPEGPRRTRALGVNGALLSLGFVVGTIGGGVITSGFDWRWTMALLAVMGAAILLGALTLLPRDGGRSAAALDVPGALLSSAGLFALVYGISTGGENGWTAPSTVGSLVAAVLLLAGFAVAESRHRSPLIPLGLLRRRNVAWSGLVGFVTFGMCGGATLLLSLYMQDGLGYTALQTGLGFLAEGVAALVGGLLAARLIGRFGAVAVIAVGLAVQAIGTGAMAGLPEGGNLAMLLVTSGAMGFGHVLAVVAFITTMTAGAHDDEQGVLGSLAQLPQNVGAIGVAVLAAIAAGAGLPAAFAVAGIVTAVGGTVGVAFLRR